MGSWPTSRMPTRRPGATWSTGHINLRDAIERNDHLRGSDGRDYELAENPATLLVRPRGLASGRAPPAGRFRAGVGLAVRLRPVPASTAPGCCSDHGTAPYFYLPRWSRTSRRGCGTTCSASRGGARDRAGTIKATVLIETLPAAFEMDEILYELREHSAGLNAGRWDYIFSAIKCFPERREMVLPDRGDVTMTVPFMRAYTELLAATCHRRGAHAMGGMAALIPSRKDQEANEKALAGVRKDKEREVAPRLRRHLGGPSRPRPGRARGIRTGPGRSAQPARAPARRRPRERRGPPRSGRNPGSRSPSRGCAPTSASAFSTSRSGWAGAAPRRSTR